MSQTALQPWEKPQYALAPAGPAPEETKPSKTIFEVLWHRRWTVAIVAGFIVLLSALHAFFGTKIWQSRGSLMVSSGNGQVPMMHPFTTPLYKDYLFTQEEILTSDPVLKAVLARRDIKHLRMLQGLRDPLHFLRRYIVVRVHHDTQMIHIYLASPYRHENSVLINTLMRVYLNDQAKHVHHKTQQVLAAYEQQSHREEASLNQRLHAMVAFKQQHAVLSFKDSKGNIQIQRLASLDKALTQAQLAAADAQAKYAAAKNLVKSDAWVRTFAGMQRSQMVTTSSDVEREQLQGELAALESKLAGLRKRYSAGEQAMRPVEASIREVKRELRREDRHFAAAYLAVLQQQAQEAHAKQQAIAGLFNTQKVKAMALNASAVQYARLRSDYTQLQKQHDVTMTSIRMLQVSADSHAINMRVQSYAGVPKTPHSPNIFEDLVVGTFLGLMFGSAAALVRETRDEHMHSAEEIRRALGLPLLGVIPHISGWWSQRNRGRRVLFDTESDVAEAFRSLRISVYGGFRPLIFKTILMTSPEKGDGKSVCVSNFAIAVAKSRRRVLIIDADLRAPSQHRIFGISNDLGLCDVLEDAATIEEAIFHTEVENLDVLPAGSLPESPVDLLASPAFAELLRTMANKYDCVLLDSPPVGPVADARVLAEISDGVVLVLRAQRSLRKASRHACAMLTAAQSELWGIVVNDTPRRNQRYGFYGGYKRRQRAPAVRRRATGAPAGMVPTVTVREVTPAANGMYANSAASINAAGLPEPAGGPRRGLTSFFG